MDHYSPNNENFVVIGDFTCEENNSKLSDFSASYGLRNLIRNPTCFKLSDNPRTIDFILTNKRGVLRDPPLLKRDYQTFM